LKVAAIYPLAKGGVVCFKWWLGEGVVVAHRQQFVAELREFSATIDDSGTVHFELLAAALPADSCPSSIPILIFIFHRGPF
jgi:hypothetical protein